jgi:ABC-2 type transport system permease protein
MEREHRPSFSLGRRWTFSLNVLLACLALLAVVAMVNYLAARHYSRFPISDNAQNVLSPFTRNVIASITNDVEVVVFFEKSEPLYESVWSLLKEYKYANSHITVQAVDPEKEPAAALLVMAKHQITSRNMVIFASKNGRKAVTASELSEVDIKPLLAGKQEVRRTHFKGELMFTSALLNVNSQRSPKAYFLKGHGTQRPDSEEKQLGYSSFAGVLAENNILYDSVGLEGPGEIPSDCNLLIIPGPTQRFTQEELEKIERYLKQGGRLFALFNYESLDKPTGLEKLLVNWGVVVGNNVVMDKANSESGPDIVLSRFGSHPMVKNLNDNKTILMIFPRSVTKLEGAAATADAPQVERLVFTGEKARVVTDIRWPDFVPRPNVADYVGPVPLAVAVEKGSLKGVKDRGSTRIVVCGDSRFLANSLIDFHSNHDFASHAINWLLARNDLLVPLAPRPVKEYRLNMTDSQRTATGWLLLAGMPGGVLLLGSMVWLRRRS